MKVRQLIVDALKPILSPSGEWSEKKILKSHLYMQLVLFLADNGMFGCFLTGPFEEPEIDGVKAVYLSAVLKDYLDSLYRTREQNISFLLVKLSQTAPVTADRLTAFLSQEKDSGDGGELLDYLAGHLGQELHLMDDKTFRTFANTMHGRTSTKAVKTLCRFAVWEGQQYQDVLYACGYSVTARSVRRSTEAYSLSMIATLHNLLLDPVTLEKYGVYEKACDSHEYANAVLYISIHLICGLRDTDLARLPHPCLPGTPDEVLSSIKKGDFSKEVAQDACELIVHWVELHDLKPNKVRRFQGMPDVVFYIPDRYRVHYGMLFLICEAHLVKNRKENSPLFHKVTDYWTIKHLLGDEVADLFKERNMCPTAMTKSFLQGISIEAAASPTSRGVAATLLGFQIPGNARSHKYQYGSYSTTTAVYLQDNAFAGLTEDVVAGELFKRGPFSCLRSLFLSLVTDGDYERAAFFQQTAMHKGLKMGPLEVEELTGAVLKAKKWAVSIWKEASKQKNLAGQKRVFAAAIKEGRLCAIEALGETCHRQDAECSFCPYRLDTLALVYHASAEACRLKRLIEASTTPAGKKKHGLLAKQFFAPATGQLIEAIKDTYGETAEYNLRTILGNNLGLSNERRERS